MRECNCFTVSSYKNTNMNGSYRNSGKCKFCCKDNYLKQRCENYIIGIKIQVELKHKGVNQNEQISIEIIKTKVENEVALLIKE